MDWEGISPFAEKLAGCNSAEVLEPEQVTRAYEERAMQRRSIASVNDDGGLVIRGKQPFGITRAMTEDVPSLPDEATLRRLMRARGMEFREEYLDRTQRWFASDERVDGEGDIIRQKWTFAEFAENSPMPYGHRWHEPPIGRHLLWKTLKREEKDYQGPALFLLGLFMTRDISPWADSVMRMVKSGFLPSGSVGFMPDEVIRVTDPDERELLGLGPYGLVFNRNRLLEFSPVTIPANMGAHTIRALRGAREALQPQDIHVVREAARLLLPANEWKEWDADFLTIATGVWTDCEFETCDPESSVLETATPERREPKRNQEPGADFAALLREQTNAVNNLATVVQRTFDDLQTHLDARESSPTEPSDSKGIDVDTIGSAVDGLTSLTAALGSK